VVPSGEGEADGVSALFGRDHEYDEFAFRLKYHLNGGSGMHLSFDEIDTMSVDRIRWWIAKLDGQREEEARAAKPPSS